MKPPVPDVALNKYRAEKSDASRRPGWIPIEIAGQPYTFEPSKRGVLDLFKLLRHYGHDIKILAKNYIVTTNLEAITEEAIQTLVVYWGSRLVAITQGTLFDLAHKFGELRCWDEQKATPIRIGRKQGYVLSWIHLHRGKRQNLILRCKHIRRGRMRIWGYCKDCPLKGGGVPLNDLI